MDSVAERAKKTELTEQLEARIRQLHAAAVEQGTPTAQAAEGQSDAFYWQKLCALRALARLCWSTAELKECAIRTLGPDVELELLAVVVNEKLPTHRRVAAAFLLDLIAPGWREEVGGIEIYFERTTPRTPHSRGKEGDTGGRAVRAAPKRKARCSARRAS